jgi:hypothetical protein
VVLAVLVLPARLHGVAVRGRRRRIGLARRADSAAGRLLERVNTFESTLDCSKLHVSQFFFLLRLQGLLFRLICKRLDDRKSVD